MENPSLDIIRILTVKFLRVFSLLIVFILDSSVFLTAEDIKKKTHLFLLAGQSNMVRFKPGASFIPALEKKFSKENIIVCKFADGGEPIRRWYRDWKSEKGETIGEKNGDLYDKMIKKFDTLINGRHYDTITFIWMQGETDARKGHSAVYGKSFIGLMAQLKEDYKTDKINYVIGRLSDARNGTKLEESWNTLRAAQVKLADDNANIEWVDTDDLNGPRNGVHYTSDGYKILGERYAAKAIALLRR